MWCYWCGVQHLPLTIKMNLQCSCVFGKLSKWSFTILQKKYKDQEYIEREGCGKKAFYCVQKRRRRDSCEGSSCAFGTGDALLCLKMLVDCERVPCSSSTDYDGFSQKSLKTFFFTLLGVADFYVTTRYPASHYIKFFKSPPFNRSHFLKSSLGTL